MRKAAGDIVRKYSASESAIPKEVSLL